MRKSCLAIGIERTTGLSDLPGAANAAKDFATWADCAGYDQIKLVCDTYSMERDSTGLRFQSADNSITAGDVKDALLSLLPKPRSGGQTGGPNNPPDRLIIFFAGHGVLHPAGQDFWMMSDSKDTREALHAQNLIRQLRDYFVFRPDRQRHRPQISIIADCCQVPPGSMDTFNLQPAGTLPAGPYDQTQSLPIDIEVMKAVPELRAAYMLPQQGQSPARCIFSSVLIEALSGAVRDNNGRCVNFDLAKYLEQIVPEKADEYYVEMFPQYHPNWRPSDNFYCEDPPGRSYPAPPPWPNFSTETETQGDNDDDIGNRDMRIGFAVGMGEAQGAGGRRKKKRGRAKGSARPAASTYSTSQRTGRTTRDSESVRAAVERQKAENAKRREEARGIAVAVNSGKLLDYSTTGCAIGISGELAVEIVTANDTCVQLSDDGSEAWLIGECEQPGEIARNQQYDKSTWALIELEGGNFVGSCAMREFITDCFVDNIGCRSMYFRGNGFGTQPWSGAEQVLESLLSGTLRSNEALDLAVLMRHSKHSNPMMGVIAAYLYDSVGDIDSIRKKAWFYAHRAQLLPFDIAMLAMLECFVDDSGNVIARVPATEAREARTEKEKEHSGYFRSTPECTLPVAGRFPLLSAGWQLIDRHLPTVLQPERLKSVAPHVIPRAPFTTLKPEGGRELIEILSN